MMTQFKIDNSHTINNQHHAARRCQLLQTRCNLQHMSASVLIHRQQPINFLAIYKQIGWLVIDIDWDTFGNTTSDMLFLDTLQYI
jgi:hypothetical protein